MRKMYTIQKCQKENNEWICTIKEPLDIKTIQPSGQVLTDSDNEAFIYLIVENDEFSYLSFSKDVWQQLVSVVQNKEKVFLQVENEKIELVNFVEELEMLLFNIEGNENYGEIFVNSVESIFAPILNGDH